jgi:hypothetical protein
MDKTQAVPGKIVLIEGVNMISTIVMHNRAKPTMKKNNVFEQIIEVILITSFLKQINKSATNIEQ